MKDIPAIEKQYMGVKALAKFLGVHPDWVYRYSDPALDDPMPFRKPGGGQTSKKFFELNEVIEWLDKKKKNEKK